MQEGGEQGESSSAGGHRQGPCCAVAEQVVSAQGPAISVAGIQIVSGCTRSLVLLGAETLRWQLVRECNFR